MPLSVFQGELEAHRAPRVTCVSVWFVWFGKLTLRIHVIMQNGESLARNRNGARCSGRSPAVPPPAVGSRSRSCEPKTLQSNMRTSWFSRSPFSTSHANMRVADSVAALCGPAAKKKPRRDNTVEAPLQQCVPGFGSAFDFVLFFTCVSFYFLSFFDCFGLFCVL